MDRFSNVNNLQEEIMSRTYRRKNVPFWHTKDEALKLIPSAYIYGKFISYYDSEKEFNNEYTKFYSDNYDSSTPDKEFRRLFGHKYDRQNTKMKVYKEVNAIERGNIVFNKAKNIDWKWY